MCLYTESFLNAWNTSKTYKLTKLDLNKQQTTTDNNIESELRFLRKIPNLNYINRNLIDKLKISSITLGNDKNTTKKLNLTLKIKTTLILK